MYVVTGCVQEGSTTWTDNTYQAAVKVPAAYFKACLRKSGTNYTAIAFFLPQTKEAYDKGVFTADFKSYKLSVTDLEKKLGTTFFVNLENLPGMDKAKAATVKNTIANW
jgi:DNA/RNA endonuclease G (NUC1)